MLKQLSYLGFRLLAGLFWLMPIWMAYGFSNFLAFVLYRVWGYRKAVVMDNLRKSFPEKSEAEIKSIAKKYYNHLAKLAVEVLKMSSLSKEYFIQNIRIEGVEILEQLKDRKTFMLCGHTGNWEWAALMFGIVCPQGFNTSYKPVSNPFFEAWFKKVRTRFGNIALPMTLMPRELMGNKRPSVTGLVADQNPSSMDNLWLQFLNRETLFFSGVERLAKKLDVAVVFADMYRTGNGQYRIHLELMTEHANTLPDGHLMQDYVTRLEKAIYLHPENWLWSHRRWKHKRA